MRIVVLLMFFIFSQEAFSQTVDSLYISTHYDKSEHFVPMRDGVELYTIVYNPKDRSVIFWVLYTRHF